MAKRGIQTRSVLLYSDEAEALDRIAAAQNGTAAGILRRLFLAHLAAVSAPPLANGPAPAWEAASSDTPFHDRLDY